MNGVTLFTLRSSVPARMTAFFLREWIMFRFTAARELGENKKKNEIALFSQKAENSLFALERFLCMLSMLLDSIHYNKHTLGFTRQPQTLGPPTVLTAPNESNEGCYILYQERMR